MLSDNEYAELLERLRFDLAPKPELAPSLPDIRSVADWTNVYIRNGETYEKWTAIEGEWVQQDLEEIMIQDFMLEVANGRIEDMSSVNKFGKNTNVDSGIDTDIYDVYAQPIWLAPTTATQHNLVSTSASDTQSIIIYGLTSWEGAEESETLTMTGITNVLTTKSWVIIHRMKCSVANIGDITAISVADTTITAKIIAGKGQTGMAIYGVGALETVNMVHYYASVIKGSLSVTVDMTLLVNPIPDVDETNFIYKHDVGISTDGSNYVDHYFKPYFRIQGPAIIKLQGNASANNAIVSAGFGLIKELS